MNANHPISYHPARHDSKALFSILIPSWNNLDHLKLCVNSIRRNSRHPHQIILHLNAATDGSREWAEAAGLDFSFSGENAGICFALNAAASLARTDYVVFMNDDMYACPDWDVPLWNEIQALNSEYFFLSSTMIEPAASGNACVLAPHDFGRSVAGFREDELMDQFASFAMPDWSGATWPPNVVHRRLWDQVGGYSIEFSPGMSSDPDFAMKLWQAGVRYFKGLGDSRVYHFMAKSTQKIVKNDGNKQFLQKWGITQSTFFKYYLRRGEAFSGALAEPAEELGLKLARLKSWVKRGF